MPWEMTSRESRSGDFAFVLVIGSAVLVLAIILIRNGLFSSWYPDPLAQPRGSVAGILDIGILVFREGLECILVLSAITASMVKSGEPYQRPVAGGVGIGFVATLITWFVAVHIVDDLSKNMNALWIQAGTGLLAVIVLLIVMNWFFHKIYWTGWISLHNKRKRELIADAKTGTVSERKWFLGMGLLGFTSFYREGVEVVLFLQTYRLKLGGDPVLYGVLLGLLLTGIVAVLTFLIHRKLPYRRMLVLTGMLLGVVLLVMVGEEAQEMQFAHWLPTTIIPVMADKIPAWMGLWFSIFPTVETLTAQAIAALAVIGSYFVARQ